MAAIDQPWFEEGMVAQVDGFGKERSRTAVLRVTNRTRMEGTISLAIVDRRGGQRGGLAIPINRAEELAEALLKAAEVAKEADGR